MRFSAILALGAFALPAIASPILGNAVAEVVDTVGDVVEIVPIVGEPLEDALESLADCLTDVTAIVPVPIKAKRSAIASPEDVIETCQGLLVTIKVHTGSINNTVASVPAGTKPTDAHIAAIKVQINLIVDAIKVVVLALGAVGGILECTLEQVQTIVALVIAIVLEVVCTLLYVIKTLNIQALLAELLSNLCKVLAGLIIVLEHVIGGVLKLVLNIINVPFVLKLVGGVLGGLLSLLGSGRVSPL